MARSSPQTQAKRRREQAKKEKRKEKLERRAQRKAQKAQEAAGLPDSDQPSADDQAESSPTEQTPANPPSDT